MVGRAGDTNNSNYISKIQKAEKTENKAPLTGGDTNNKVNAQATPAAPNDVSTIVPPASSQLSPNAVNMDEKMAQNVGKSFGENASALKELLTNDNGGDIQELKDFIDLYSGLNDAQADNIAGKLRSTDHDAELKGFIDAFKTHPNPDEALKNLITTLAGGTVNVLNDDPGC